MTASLLVTPTEIRLNIYRYVLSATIVTIRAQKVPPPAESDYGWDVDSSVPLGAQLDHELAQLGASRTKTALLSVCRQIREEAAPLFFPNVIFNFHVGSIMWVTEKTRQEVSKKFYRMFDSCPAIDKIERLAFFVESNDLFRHEISRFTALKELIAWDWKQLCETENEYFGEVGCGSTRHEEYNDRMADILHGKLDLQERSFKTYFQHAVCDTMDDVLELSADGTFTHQVVPCRDAVISRADMDIENLCAYPLR